MEQQPDYIQDYLESEDVVASSWRKVAASLKQATLECMAADDSRREKLEATDFDDFWSVHVDILDQIETEEPGIAQVIMTRAEALHQEQLRQDAVEFETVTLPQAKRLAFKRSLMKAIDPTILFR